MKCLFVVLLFAGLAPCGLVGQPVLRWTIEGAPLDQFGFSVGNVGDFDGDGLADFVIGAIKDEAVGTEVGFAEVYSGGTGQLIVRLSSTVAGEFFGFSAAGAGDVNGDGFADVIVGAPRFNLTQGRAYVFAGPSGTLIHTLTGEAPGHAFGVKVSRAGDVNNDGKSDLLVGARFHDGIGADSGRAYLYCGMTANLLNTVSGEAPGDQLGIGVAPAGDTNNDGTDDYLVGAFNHSSGGFRAGRAYLFSGADHSLLHAWDGEGALSPNGAEMGVGLDSIGDINGDGHDDVVVTAKETDASAPNSGRTYVFSGADYSAIYVWDGEGAGDQFGQSASAAGDVNGDGIPDIIVGSDSFNNTGTESGKAYVYSGATGLLLFTVTGQGPEDRLGFSVSGGGDMDGDGLGDVVIGAFLDETTGTMAGRVFVYHGPGQGGPGLGACAVGNVGFGAGDPVLTVNGSLGGAHRRVDLGPGAPFTIELAQAPGYPSPGHHMIFVQFGVPGPASSFPLPFGVGAMCFTPCFLSPGPAGFTLTNTVAPLAACGPVFAGAGFTPWSTPHLNAPPGPLSVTIQGVIEQAPLSFAVTNALVVDID